MQDRAFKVTPEFKTLISSDSTLIVGKERGSLFGVWKAKQSAGSGGTSNVATSSSRT